MSISDQLLKLNTAKQNIKNAIQDNLKQDLSEVAFVDYHEYIKSNGGYCAPTLNITFEEKAEYVVGESVTFNGVTSTLDGSTILSDVPIFYDDTLMVSSDPDGRWSFTTTWKSGGCTFTVKDDTYGIVCRENVYPHEQFFDSFTNLQTLVDTLKDGETLTLDCNYRYLETGTGDGVTIGASNITIDGQGKYTLDGNNLSRIIQNTNTNVTKVSLKGLTFKNGVNSAIKNENGSDWSINDCVFEHNSANYYGGAIYNKNGTDWNISDCIFTHNSVIQDTAGGGAIYNWNGINWNISDCTFTNNFTPYFGGAINDRRSVGSNINGCTFVDNSATQGGGAIYIEFSSGLTMVGCSFISNSAEYGGAINNWGSNCTASGCSFINNSASKRGSVIDGYSEGNIDADNCYWGTNSPTFDSSMVYNTIINTYLILEITTGTIDSKQYIEVMAKQYNPSTSSTSINRIYTGEVKAEISVGDNIYTKIFRNGIVSQTYTAPTAPYDITVQLESGDILVKTIES